MHDKQLEYFCAGKLATELGEQGSRRRSCKGYGCAATIEDARVQIIELGVCRGSGSRS